MFKLIYGNKYIENVEEWNKEKPSDRDMLTTALDCLDAYQFLCKDELPEDWYGTIFWKIEEI